MLQSIQSHQGVIRLLGAGTAFGHPQIKRRLTALKAPGNPRSRARFLSAMATAAGASARTDPTTHTLPLHGNGREGGRTAEGRDILEKENQLSSDNYRFLGARCRTQAIQSNCQPAPALAFGSSNDTISRRRPSLRFEEQPTDRGKTPPSQTDTMNQSWYHYPRKLLNQSFPRLPPPKFQLVERFLSHHSDCLVS